MKKLLALLSFILLFITTANLQAQDRFSVSLLGGYGSGAYEPARSGIGEGELAWRVNVSYAILSILDGYVGYSRTGFKCEAEETIRPGDPRPFCVEAPVDFTSSGFNFGLRLNRPDNASVWIPWLRVGLVYKTLDISQTKESESFNYSDSGLGFEIGTGLAYPVTEHIKIVPAFNYTRYTIEGANGESNPVVVIMGLIGARYSF